MFPGLPDDNKDNRITAEKFSELRQNIDSQNNFVFEERRSDLNRSKNVFIGAVSGVILAGIVGWFVLSPRYAQNDTAEIPVIRRSPPSPWVGVCRRKNSWIGPGVGWTISRFVSLGGAWVASPVTLIPTNLCSIW